MRSLPHTLRYSTIPKKNCQAFFQSFLQIFIGIFGRIGENFRLFPAGESLPLWGRWLGEAETDEVTFAAHRNHNAPDEGHPCLPLGEGAAPAADEGRYQVGPCTAPHPSRASPGPPSRKERVFCAKTRPINRAGITLLRLLVRTLVELLGFIQRHCKLLRPFVDKSASETILHTNTTNGPVDPAIPRWAVDNPAEAL